MAASPGASSLRSPSGSSPRPPLPPRPTQAPTPRPVPEHTTSSTVLPDGLASPERQFQDSLLPPPPPYSLIADDHGERMGQTHAHAPWLAVDPRYSSSQSLAPSTVGDGDGDANARRILLVVYIHGFYGNDQSFRSFPAHVHSFLRTALADTHVVHSKIYPRYKTYKAIEIARDNFSEWLQPHEGPRTDVVLVGHSMGGILAAEIVLMPNRHPYSSHPFKHRILGTISLDCPFLGLHPGIIVSGISSLFRPGDDSIPPPPEPNLEDPSASTTALSPPPSSGPMSPTAAGQSNSNPNSLYAASGTDLSIAPTLSPTESSSSVTPMSSRSAADSFFNPPFWNDNSFEERPFRQRLVRFVKKHSSEGIFGAAKNHVLSHLEYGGCLADYPALHTRYHKIRALEDVDELEALGRPGGIQNLRQSGNVRTKNARVRFVNYYTISTGRPKKARSRSRSRSASQAALGTTASVGLGDRALPVTEEDIRGETNTTEGLPPETAASHGTENVPTPGIQVESFSDKKTGESLPPADHDNHSALSDASGRSSGDPKPKSTTSLSEPFDSTRPLDKPEPDLSTAADTTDLDPGTCQKEEQNDSLKTPEETPSLGDDENQGLPAIPDLPSPPQPADLERFTDKDSRKQAEKEAKRQQKAYEAAVKDRDKALKERQKLADKRRKKAEKTVAKAEKEALKQKAKEEKDEEKRGKDKAKQKAKAIKGEAEEDEEHTSDDGGNARSGGGSHHSATETDSTEKGGLEESEKKASAQQSIDAASFDRQAKSPSQPKLSKARKFCVLPRKVAEGHDETWVSVFMEGVDEVGAHCGLFVPAGESVARTAGNERIGAGAGDEAGDEGKEGSERGRSGGGGGGGGVEDGDEGAPGGIGNARYDNLVGDVGQRVVGWVQDSLSKEAVLKMALEEGHGVEGHEEAKTP